MAWCSDSSWASSSSSFSGLLAQQSHPQVQPCSEVRLATTAQPHPQGSAGIDLISSRGGESDDSILVGRPDDRTGPKGLSLPCTTAPARPTCSRTSPQVIRVVGSDSGLPVGAIDVRAGLSSAAAAMSIRRTTTTRRCRPTMIPPTPAIAGTAGLLLASSGRGTGYRVPGQTPAGTGERRSRPCGLIADAPLVACPVHGPTVAAAPWARHDSAFTRV